MQTDRSTAGVDPIAQPLMPQALMPQPLMKGLWGVLATPFFDDLTIDHASLARQVRAHLTCGSIGLVALGVFGESAQLSAAERREALATVRGEAPDTPVVIGIAERDTDGAIASATDLLGENPSPSTSMMLQVNSSDPDMLIRHVHAVHAATGAGVVVQDYPVISGVTIATHDLVTAVNACPFAVAVKSEAPPTSLAIAELVAGTNAPVFGGLGGLGLLDELLSGAAGAMTGFSFPLGLAQTVAAWFHGGYTAAREAFLPWMPLVNFEAQPRIGLALRKQSLAEQGIFTTGAVRPPAAAMPAALLPTLRQHLDGVRDSSPVS